jgi:hypothetical protein
MALRKQAFKRSAVRDDLQKLLAESRAKPVTEDELHEQRVSFAFGNAMEMEHVTKQSVRETAQKIRLKG